MDMCKRFRHESTGRVLELLIIKYFENFRFGNYLDIVSTYSLRKYDIFSNLEDRMDSKSGDWYI